MSSDSAVGDSVAEKNEASLQEFCSYFRMALAVAVIRSTPVQFASGEAFAEHLLSARLQREETEDDLKAELLRLKQQMLTERSPAACCSPSSADLRPPSTADLSLRLRQHSEFLNRIFILRNSTAQSAANQPETAAEADLISQTVRAVFSTMRSCIPSADNILSIDLCVEAVRSVAQLSSAQSFSMIATSAEEFTKFTICCIIAEGGGGGGGRRWRGRVEGGGSSLEQIVCRCLLQCILQCSSHLNQVQLKKTSLQSGKIENAFYILRTLEYVLMRRRVRRAPAQNSHVFLFFF
ncbi:hypothetical protein CAPTEDRAFT_200961 [Capitella teleta]|uniref:Uncharacterized protein n=1 Tax=Capitella teleta TaxID=283909 RepID=R7TI83_CAPTE|nr:hypothetical protein CAPTEDRAFT_200961 [Capitella teleta]|eukprot:ELT93543.1 hypothetical protein CAPTEDRAFT_200961 [Capitella teleta]